MPLAGLPSVQPAPGQDRQGAAHVLDSGGALHFSRACGCAGWQEGEVAGRNVRTVEGSAMTKAAVLQRKSSSTCEQCIQEPVWPEVAALAAHP